MTDTTTNASANAPATGGRERYTPQEIEPKWQARWQETALYRTDLTLADGRPKFYNLMEFPYPSAEGLHVGHTFTFGGADTNGRFQRMRGQNVFEPMGFDAFGIHSENYALKMNINPMQLTARTTARYRYEQLGRIGAMFDWDHSVDTSQPNYYKWTQWIFLQLFKAGLAIRKEAPVNWCPSCLTVLANEQVIDGHCERCGTPVIQRELTQWFFTITKYADRLLDNLAGLDWPDESKVRQANWIGRSAGAQLAFAVDGHAGATIPVFTTRPDTVFGATYVVLAPEHKLVPQITTDEQRHAVEQYVEGARAATEIERTDAGREKTGAFTGAHALNPATGARVPIWVADYVLVQYGTGAIMAVPGHDERDYDFARTFDLPIIEVVGSEAGIAEAAYTGPGTLINSGQFDGLGVDEGKAAVTAWLAERGLGEPRVTYRLRDWLISRQRYWGPPIPIIYCDKCGTVPVPEADLPVTLPEIDNFRPTGTGKSPLASVESFVNTTCPECGGPATRETDVSDNFLDSAWYFLRYTSTDFDDRPFDPERIKAWVPVDMYFGGKEHVVMHHLYARFITMALHDLGHLPFEEPFAHLRLHGFVTKDGAKMSKSRGNVVNPDDYIGRVGSDAFRVYLLFIGPFDQDNDFNDQNLVGVTRFLDRVWRLMTDPAPTGGRGDGHAPAAPVRQARDRRAGPLPVPHRHRGADGVLQLGGSAARGVHRRAARRGAADAESTAGAARPLPGRGAVGAPGGRLQRPPAGLADLRPGADRRGDGDDADRAGERQAARPHRRPGRADRGGRARELAAASAKVAPFIDGKDTEESHLRARASC